MPEAGESQVWRARRSGLDEHEGEHVARPADARAPRPAPRPRGRAGAGRCGPVWRPDGAPCRRPVADHHQAGGSRAGLCGGRRGLTSGGVRRVGGDRGSSRRHRPSGARRPEGRNPPHGDKRPSEKRAPGGTGTGRGAFDPWPSQPPPSFGNLNPLPRNVGHDSGVIRYGSITDKRNDGELDKYP